MTKSVYSEVTAVSTSGFERDRVLDKLKTSSTGLPFYLSDIKISHNDFAVADVYNDSIRKLYANYLFLIANAELTTKTSPTTGDLGYWVFDDTLDVQAISSVTTNPVTGASTGSLSSTKETHIIKKTFSDDGNDYFLYFNYSPDESIVFDSRTTLSNPNTLLSGNFVEFNKTFKFKNVVSVDIKDNILFVLDKELNTAFKFDITGLITNDPALRRTDKNDSTHPGRYLLKTIGGGGVSQTKNKLKDPLCLSIHGDYVYILDNGHFSLKVFDLDFNFIKEIKSIELFTNVNNGVPVSIVIDERSDTDASPYGYILTNKGKILEYNVTKNTVSVPYSPFDVYDTRMQSVCSFFEDENFSKIVNSKSSKNILYISNNKNIFKFYKTNFNLPITTFDFTVPNFTITGLSANKILSFDSTLHDDADYLAVTTTPFSAHNAGTRISPAVTYVFADKNITTKLYNESFYTNYFSLSDILVLPQEVVNNITFNKTIQKLIYNHFSLFENLNKKVYSYYRETAGMFLIPTLCAVNYKGFDKPTNFTIDDNFYIGVNEPLLTDIINRPLALLYKQQEELFDLIKEESLNVDPPLTYPMRLPGKFESSTNVLSITPSTSTISASGSFDIEISRTNEAGLNNSCTFYYYTDDTSVDDITPYISPTNKSYTFFEKNAETTVVSIKPIEFHVGDDKTFTFVIEPRSNCVLDPDRSTFVGTITAVGTLYYISLSAASTSLTVKEGDTVRIGIERSNETEDYSGESICNIEIESLTAPLTDHYPNIAKANIYSYVVSETEDFGAVPGSNVPGQTFAHVVGDTSTLHFTPSVSSIVFDLSAVNNLAPNDVDRLVTVRLSNPDDSSELGTGEDQLGVGTERTVRINDEPKTINLFLSSISATYETGTTNMLSCVNVWEALSASTATTNTNAFSTISATNPIQATFTVHEPLSVFSVSALSGALQFDAPDGSFIYDNNEIDFIVESGAALVGKGGNGGYGHLWLSGYDFTIDGTGTDDLSSSDLDGTYINGGPAISDFDDYFNLFTISNSGKVYGGSGGGAGGLIGVSATSMPHVSSLSAGAGGGGGAGIHASNYGVAGLAAIDGTTVGVFTQHSLWNTFLTNGAPGTYAAGGAGGGFGVSTVATIGDGNVTLDTYPSMTGLDGGDLGEGGGTDSAPVAPTNGVDASWTNTLLDGYKTRAGGAKGKLINTTKSGTASGTGEFKGIVDPLTLA